VLVRSAITPDQQSLIILSIIELDQPRQVERMRRLLEGLEAMCPEMIVICGRLFTEHANETESTDKFKSYVDAISQIIRDMNCIYLRDHTEWVFVPSIEDAG